MLKQREKLIASIDKGTRKRPFTYCCWEDKLVQLFKTVLVFCFSGFKNLFFDLAVLLFRNLY